MKQYTITYRFVRTVESEVEFTVDEEELVKFTDMDEVLGEDAFNDAVQEETSGYPSFGEVEIYEMNVRKINK